jgi:hypothetical protein
MMNNNRVRRQPVPGVSDIISLIIDHLKFPFPVLSPHSHRP